MRVRHRRPRARFEDRGSSASGSIGIEGASGFAARKETTHRGHTDTLAANGMSLSVRKARSACTTARSTPW
jgi:hypothetical protein